MTYRSTAQKVLPCRRRHLDLQRRRHRARACLLHLCCTVMTRSDATCQGCVRARVPGASVLHGDDARSASSSWSVVTLDETQSGSKFSPRNKAKPSGNVAVPLCFTLGDKMSTCAQNVDPLPPISLMLSHTSEISARFPVCSSQCMSLSKSILKSSTLRLCSIVEGVPVPYDRRLRCSSRFYPAPATQQTDLWDNPPPFGFDACVCVSGLGCVLVCV